MFILAFETSCDDTSIAVFRDQEILAMVTRSQIREHNETRWVVPEVAARLHANVVFDVLREVLEKADVELDQIDLIACTEHPGLVPSLLVGITVAKSLSKLLDIEYMAIDHIQAHMFANYLERGEDTVVFPAICLTVSGGHNELYLWRSMFDREKLGETLDDSAGEAFDKVAKMMGLGYPGGPIISQYASEYIGSFQSIFPEVLLEKDSLNFSFSGLKSAVKREVDRRITNYKLQIINDGGDSVFASGAKQSRWNDPTRSSVIPEAIGDLVKISSEQDRWDSRRSLSWTTIQGGNDGEKDGDTRLISGTLLPLSDIREIAFEFQQTTVNILSYKLLLAARQHGIASLVLAGWVSANDHLRETIEAQARELWYSFVCPKLKKYSQDNAAMVGILAYYRKQHKA